MHVFSHVSLFVFLQSSEKLCHKRLRLLSPLSFKLRHTRLKQTDAVSKSKHDNQACICICLYIHMYIYVYISIKIDIHMKIYNTCCPLTIAQKYRRGSLHIGTATVCILKSSIFATGGAAPQKSRHKRLSAAFCEPRSNGQHVMYYMRQPLQER